MSESSASLLTDDPLWFKDAVIYEIHVRAFNDSNGDGIGDINGLIEKLDYLLDWLDIPLRALIGLLPGRS